MARTPGLLSTITIRDGVRGRFDRVRRWAVVGLAKTYKIDVSATSFVFAPEFPANLRGDLSVTLTPDAGILIDNSSQIQNYTIGVTGSINQITLSGSSPSGSTGAFGVTFSWNYNGTDPRLDYTTVAAFVPRYIYSVKNTPRFGTTDPFTIAADSSASPLQAPRLRCDHAVATEAASPEDGCVFSEAAPILELSKSGNAAEEAAHVEQAQTSKDAYKTQYSPGVFSPILGTRAVANESGGAQFIGLTRGEETDRGLNNGASCTNANALIKVRPYSGSSSCPSPKPSQCQCDEYPFAVTKDGGAYDPQGTSARYILGTHNASGGAQLTNFFRRDRVFRGEKFWVRVIP